MNCLLSRKRNSIWKRAAYRSISLSPFSVRISRAQNDEPWLGRVFPVEEDHETQATLQRLVPHDGGIQVQMRLIFSCAEVLETAQGLGS